MAPFTFNHDPEWTLKGVFMYHIHPDFDCAKALQSRINIEQTQITRSPAS